MENNFERLKALIEDCLTWEVVAVNKTSDHFDFYFPGEIPENIEEDSIDRNWGFTDKFCAFPDFLNFLKKLGHIGNFMTYTDTLQKRSETNIIVHFINENVYMKFSGYYSEDYGSDWDDYEITRVYPNISIQKVFKEEIQDSIQIAEQLSSVESILVAVKNAK